jgi:hydrogenase-1 operon protein HyaF
MSALSEIPVRIETGTGNVLPLLHEIRHALQRLATDTGDSAGASNTVGVSVQSAAAVIDLRSLPLAPGEEERIDTLLGVGEVRAELNALGPTVVQETRMSGVWVVTHRNANDEVVAKFIEVTRMPSILQAQNEDIWRGVALLNQELGIDEQTPGYGVVHQEHGDE